MSRGFVTFYDKASDAGYSQESLGWTLGGGLEVSYGKMPVDAPVLNPFIPLQMNQIGFNDVQI